MENEGPRTLFVFDPKSWSRLVAESAKMAPLLAWARFGVKNRVYKFQPKSKSHMGNAQGFCLRLGGIALLAPSRPVRATHSPRREKVKANQYQRRHAVQVDEMRAANGNFFGLVPNLSDRARDEI